MPFGFGIACQACGQMGGMPIGVKLSSLGKRFGANLLSAFLFFATLIVGYIIWSLIIWERGATPAKQLLGMRVISTIDRQPASWGRMFLREVVGKFLLCGVIGSFVFFGGLIATLFIFGEKRQPLWDRLASTLVVDMPAEAA